MINWISGLILWTGGIYVILVVLYCRKENLHQRLELPLIGLLSVLLLIALAVNRFGMIEQLFDHGAVLVTFLALWLGSFAALAATYQKKYLEDRKISDLVFGSFFSLGTLGLVITLAAGTTI